MQKDPSRAWTASTRHDHYQEVTDKIIAALESGVVPWRKGWDASKCNVPFNAVTRHAYRGINRLLLDLMQMRRNASDPRWCSYRQAQAQGWQVRRGESGTRIYFYRRIERARRASDGEQNAYAPEDRKIIPVLRAYVIFHASQIDGIADYVSPGTDYLPWRKPEAVQAILDASGIEIRAGGNEACYIPHEDVILLPPAHAFESAESWAVTAIHELSHASGARQRLNRELNTRFGSAAYAAEEVLVECASSLVCSTLGLAVDYANNASYIDTWVGVMRADKRAIFRIATEAQRVADYILGLHRDFAAITQGIVLDGEQGDDAAPRAEAA